MHFPGGDYPDAWPSGEYCVRFQGRHVLTHNGQVELPHGEPNGPMMLRCTPFNGFKFAGLATAHLNRLWEWTLNGWRVIDVDRLAGQSPVIYDRSGNLVYAPIPAGGGWSSQGYRFVDEDGVVVTGQDTYGPFHGLSEWSRASDLLIGQGHERGGVRIWDGSNLRVLDTGYQIFVRVNRIGQDVAISYFGEGSAKIVYATINELRALPLDSQPEPSPEPEPPPEPPTEPPMPQQMPLTAWHVITAMHRQFSAGLPATEDGGRTFTHMCIQQLLFDDPMGGWCWKKSASTSPPSKDCVARQIAGRFEGWDILQAAGRQGPKQLAAYPPQHHNLTGQVPVQVLPVNHIGSGPPEPPEPPDVPDTPAIEELSRQIAKLGEDVLAWKADLDEYTAKVDALSRQVEAIRRYPLQRLRIVPEGPDPEAPAYSTSRSLGHAHNVRPARYRLEVLPE